MSHTRQLAVGDAKCRTAYEPCRCSGLSRPKPRQHKLRPGMQLGD